MTHTPSRTAVIAIGGNSLIKDKRHPEVRHQWDAVRETTAHVVDIIAAGWNVVITHGNGPQVGFILRRNELAAHEVHTTPLSLIVADTQGSIGYMLQQALNNEFYRRGVDHYCLALVTQVLVDDEDKAFQNPTKPIGGFMDEETARRFESEGWNVVEDAGRGWRRVVASPEPVRIIEAEAIEQALKLGWAVVAVGGGGIPVARNEAGELRGRSAVIDKDRASSLLATMLNADLLLISTGVERVALNFGKPEQQELDRITVAQAEQYAAAGHFAPGSMLPKIEACIRFLKQAPTGAQALITNPENLSRAIQGETGTLIVQDGA
ncbi:MAG: carbamate kinase [Caldilineaceae bacterium]|nr:carbamate kinase [Caldilineaceae bacterium]